MQNRDNAFKVHTAEDGYIWYTVGDHMPVPSTMKLDSFMKNPPFNMGDTVRLLGCHSNLDLILALYKRKQQNRLSSLQVCTPKACHGRFRQKKPEVVLLDANHWFGWPASLGGWHEFNEYDYPSYVMAQENDDQTLTTLLRQHPVYQPVTFIPHLDHKKLCQLLGLLLDPRWYVDPEQPEKCLKMEGYLGLNTKTQYNVTNNKADETNPFYGRAKLVMETWKSTTPSEDSRKDPRYFLYRIHACEKSSFMADLRTSQAFIAFLRNNWLHEIYRNRGGAGCDGLFIPEYFFKTKEEIDAFKEHIAVKPLAGK